MSVLALKHRLARLEAAGAARVYVAHRRAAEDGVGLEIKKMAADPVRMEYCNSIHNLAFQRGLRLHEVEHHPEALQMTERFRAYEASGLEGWAVYMKYEADRRKAGGRWGVLVETDGPLAEAVRGLAGDAVALAWVRRMGEIARERDLSIEWVQSLPEGRRLMELLRNRFEETAGAAS